MVGDPSGVGPKIKIELLLCRTVWIILLFVLLNVGVPELRGRVVSGVAKQLKSVINNVVRTKQKLYSRQKLFQFKITGQLRASCVIVYTYFIVRRTY